MCNSPKENRKDVHVLMWFEMKDYQNSSRETNKKGKDRNVSVISISHNVQGHQCTIRMSCVIRMRAAFHEIVELLPGSEGESGTEPLVGPCVLGTESRFAGLASL